jgi:hypothetical protein
MMVEQLKERLLFIWKEGTLCSVGFSIRALAILQQMETRGRNNRRFKRFDGYFSNYGTRLFNVNICWLVRAWHAYAMLLCLRIHYLAGYKIRLNPVFL